MRRWLVSKRNAGCGLRTANCRPTQFRNPQSAIRHRHGLSLMLVMVAISLSLMLTFATVSSQSRGLQVRHNVNRRELARRAAESGAAIALAKMQSSSWSGVLSPLQGGLASDTYGSTSYRVQFLTIDGQASPAGYSAASSVIDLGWAASIYNPNANGLTESQATTAATATRQAFQLLVRVTGKSQSATDAADFVNAVTEVGVELHPRAIGRSLLTGESATVNDFAPNSAGYDTIQSFAVFASVGASNNPSLALEPGQRIDGRVWLQRGLRIFNGPRWGSTTRNDYLQGVGTRFGSGTAPSSLLHPHPFGSDVTHFSALSTSEKTDLETLNVPFQQTTTTPAIPNVTFSDWKQYKLYQGGFTYDAEIISATRLDGDVLRPTPRNPLGLFYRDGNLELDDNVVIQGTLVCSGKVSFTGNNVLIASVNWRDGSGDVLLPDANWFPRLPAIVARDVAIGGSVRVTVEGAIVLTNALTGGNGSFQERNVTPVELSGSQATCRSLRQPFSLVQIGDALDLSVVENNGHHALWLADGASGNWFPIVAVDSVHRNLTILGEANLSGPRSFRIRRQRLHAVDLRGPIMADRLQLTVPSVWKLSTSLWNSQHAIWEFFNDNEMAQGRPPVPFVDWVGDPANYTGWGNPYDDFGLPLESTVQIRPIANVKFRESLPVFRSYVPSAAPLGMSSDPGGYRWQVLFWRQVP